MRNTDPGQANSPQPLLPALETVLRSRHEIAVELQQAAANLSGAARRRSLALSRWFDQPTTADDVLRRTDALAVCLPLLPPAVRGAVSPLHIEDAVASALNALRRPVSRTRRLIADLAYPLVLLLVCGLFWIAFAVYLVPVFDQMFTEFQLDLPRATFAVIGLARLTRRWGLAAVVLLALLLSALWTAGYIQRRRRHRRRGSRLVGRWFSSTRAAWAAWAWHVALLLEAGLSQPDAISWAGRANDQDWIDQISQSWAEQIRQGRDPFERTMNLNRQPGYLLRWALQVDDSAAQAELLHEVAAIDWHRNRTRSRWWLWWVTPMIVCFVGSMIGLIVAALFLPLVSLITGLS